MLNQTEMYAYNQTHSVNLHTRTIQRPLLSPNSRKKTAFWGLQMKGITISEHTGGRYNKL